jgi:hypothetical protein
VSSFRSAASGIASFARRVSERFTALLGDYEARGLELSEFTAVLSLREEASGGREQLLDELRQLDQTEPSPLMAVPGLHQARFLVFEHAKLAANEVAPAFPFGPLVFSCVYEGDTEDLLSELFERCGETLQRVFAHCAVFPDGNVPHARVQHLMAAGIESSYFFRDRDVSRSELQRAVEVRRRFVDFAIHQQGATDSDLRRAFDRLRAGLGLGTNPSKPAAAGRRVRASVRAGSSLPANDTTAGASGRPSDPAALGDATFDLRLDYGIPLLPPFERAIPAERYWVRRSTELVRARLRRDAREARRHLPGAAPSPAALAKEHALVRATFIVRSDLPAELQRGVFVPGARYAAWVRFSNGLEILPDDAGGDARGFAIKLEHIEALGRPIEQESTSPASQDFVLASHPTSFVKDARDYAVFRSIVDTRDVRVRAQRLFVFALRRPRETVILARRLLQRTRETFAVEYHSMTASALGSQLAVKYSVGSIAALQPSAAEIPDPKREATDTPAPTAEAPPSWRDQLQRRLDPDTSEGLSLEFSVLAPSRDVLPVEDCRIDWQTAGAKRIPIARIEIEPQDFNAADRVALADTLVFTPWHTLEEHRPLGGLNRARLDLFRAMHERAAKSEAVIRSPSSAPHPKSSRPRPKSFRPRPNVQLGSSTMSLHRRKRSRSLH